MLDVLMLTRYANMSSGPSMLQNAVAPHQLQMTNGMMMSMSMLTALARCWAAP